MLFFPDRRFRNKSLQTRFHLGRSFEGLHKGCPRVFVHHKKSLVQKGLFGLFANAGQDKFSDALPRRLGSPLDKGRLDRRSSQPQSPGAQCGRPLLRSGSLCHDFGYCHNNLPVHYIFVRTMYEHISLVSRKIIGALSLYFSYSSPLSLISFIVSRQPDIKSYWAAKPRRD